MLYVRSAIGRKSFRETSAAVRVCCTEIVLPLINGRQWRIKPELRSKPKLICLINFTANHNRKTYKQKPVPVLERDQRAKRGRDSRPSLRCKSEGFIFVFFQRDYEIFLCIRRRVAFVINDKKCYRPNSNELRKVNVMNSLKCYGPVPLDTSFMSV